MGSQESIKYGWRSTGGFVILASTLVLFVWGRWRHDLMALAALLLVFVAGLVDG